MLLERCVSRPFSGAWQIAHCAYVIVRERMITLLSFVLEL